MSVSLQPLRCLLVEDSEDDARLLLRNLRDSGYAVTSERVDTPEAMRAALERGPWDIIISDYTMPRFSGRAALELLQSTGQDVPFIVVSGNIGEDLAVETMRAGAHDYVMKGRLTRLGPAVARELGEAAKRRVHRQMERTLRLQAAALAAAGNAIVITDREGNIEWVNPAFATLTGYALDEVIGKNPRDLVKSGVHDVAFYQELWATILAGRTWHGELVNRRKDGTLYHEKQTISPVRDPDGVITRFIAIKQDLSERKEAETALRESERFNRSTLDALGAHIAVLDASGSILTTNRAWKDFARANAAQLSSVNEGANYLEVCERAARNGSVDAARIAAGIRAVAEGREAEWIFEYPCHSPTEERWYYCTVRRFTGKGPVRVVVAHENISTLKEAQAALQESESRYRLVFERNPLPMWVYDSATLAILAANEAAIHHYGYSAEQYRHLTFRDLHNPEDVAALVTHLNRLGPDGISVRETRHRKQDGTIIHTEVFSRPLTYGGRPAQLAMAADITEKMQIQEKFLHAQRLESLGMLAAGIAHDLNNVLAPIMFAAPLLQGSLTSARDKKVLDTLSQCAARGSGLVKQILGFAGATSGEFQTLQVKHIARDVIGVIEETFPKSIRLDSHIPSDLWPIRGDATQIHQILLNLCVNARDAMPHGGTLSLVAQNRLLDAVEAAAIPGAHSGAWLVLEVADTGTGIPPEVLAHMWEPFFTTKAPGKGTGLGLSTVRGIVSAHSGFLTIETQMGHGTTFRTYLPSTETELLPTKSAAPFSAHRGQGQLILVVDDDEAMRYITAEILTTNGYRVVTANNGAEAIPLFNLRPGEISLVVTDVAMPTLGGVALARALRLIRPDIPLLAMSGLTTDNTPDADINVIQPLVGGFLHKPFKEADLLGAVHRLLPALPSIPS